MPCISAVMPKDLKTACITASIQKKDIWLEVVTSEAVTHVMQDMMKRPGQHWNRQYVQGIPPAKCRYESDYWSSVMELIRVTGCSMRYESEGRAMHSLRNRKLERSAEFWKFEKIRNFIF